MLPSLSHRADGFLTPDGLHAARVEKYALKRVVGQIYPASSTARCSETQLPGRPVQLWKSHVHQTVFLVGLVHCASLWSCPVCAAKISQRRGVDLEQAAATWLESGGSVYLLTATIPHGVGDDLSQILRQMLRAWADMVDSRRFKGLRTIFDLAGIVRSVEVTYSTGHGWHPHIHALLFLRRSVESTWFLRDEYYHLWSHQCLRAGLPLPSPAYGLRVDDGSAPAVASYLVSHGTGHWGLSQELTRGHIKKARGGSFSPWDMLRYIHRYGSRDSGSREAERLFIAYSRAFHGCRQLHFSKGLKTQLGIGTASDVELVADQRDNASPIAEIHPTSWRAVLARHQVPDLFRIAESRPELLQSFLKP